jgi:hypothetical protein
MVLRANQEISISQQCSFHYACRLQIVRTYRKLHFAIDDFAGDLLGCRLRQFDVNLGIFFAVGGDRSRYETARHHLRGGNPQASALAFTKARGGGSRGTERVQHAAGKGVEVLSGSGNAYSRSAAIQDLESQSDLKLANQFAQGSLRYLEVLRSICKARKFGDCYEGSDLLDGKVGGYI